MPDPIATALSVLALAISATTAWLTLFRRGTVKMTQPTIIFFGMDAPRHHGDVPLAKVFLRTLLFATGKRGRIIENMYVVVTAGGRPTTFSFWGYGARENLVRGSGLFVGETGVEANHHFVLPKEGAGFRFTAGEYRVDVFAHLLGNRKRKLLLSQLLQVTDEMAARLDNPQAGIMFDWKPEAAKYEAYVDTRTGLGA